MTIYRWLASIILGIFFVIPSVAIALFGTETGSRWVVDKAIHYSPIDIRYDQFRGKLLTEFSFNNLRVESESFAYQTEALKIHWQPLALLSGSITAERIKSDHGEVRLRSTEANPNNDNQANALNEIKIELPLSIDIQKLTVSDTLFFFFEAPAQKLGVNLSAKANTRGRVTLRNLDISHQYVTASVRGQSLLSYPFKSSLNTKIELNSPDYPALTINSLFKGDIRKLVTETKLSDSLNASLEATLHQPAKALSWSVTSQWNESNLTPWLKAFDLGDLSLVFNGAVAGEGSLNSAILSPDLSVTVNQRNAAISGRLTYESNALTINSLNVSSDNDIRGELLISGSIVHLDSVPVIDVTSQWDTVLYKPSDIISEGGKLTVSGAIDNLSARLSSDINGLLPQPFKLTSEAKLASKSLNLTTLKLSQNNNMIAAEATIDWSRDISLNANVTGTYEGHDVNSKVSMSYAAPYLFVESMEGNWGAQSFNINGALSSGRTLNWELQSDQLSQVSELQGTALARGTINGVLNQPEFTIGLDSAELKQTGYKKVYLTQPTDLTLSSKNANFRIHDLCIGYAEISSPLCIQLDKDKSWLSFKANAQSVPINALQALVIPSALYKLQGDLELDIEGSVDIETKTFSQLNASINANNTKVSTAEETVTLEKLQFVAKTKEQGLQANVIAQANELGLNLNGYVETGSLEAGSKLSGTLDFDSDSLELANLLLPQVSIGNGKASARIAIDGTVDTPLASGKVQLNANQIVVLQSGTMLNDVTGTLQADANSGQFKVEADGKVGSGKLQITGHLDAFKQFGKLDINGNDLLIIDTPDLLIEASPELTVSLDKKLISLNGKLNIPKARITPIELNQATTESADVRLKNEEKKTSVFKTQTDLTVSLGENVRVKALGFAGQIQGSLNITQQPNSPARGNGTIGVTSGQYEIYGQKLTIERGDLLFNDVPLSSPSLNLRVTRNISSSTSNQKPPEEIGARVTGSIEQPELSLFSTPPMSDSTILSYLLFGKPPGSQGDVNNLELQAALLVGGRSTEFLTDGLKETFDLDEVSLDSRTSDVNDTSLYIGKHLSPDLYIKYGIGLIEPTSTFILRYSLTDKLIFESVSNAEGQGGDLIYTIEK
jgi:translocation and assembly module TamB